jgi:uncharacterized protein (TIGR02145 family)
MKKNIFSTVLVIFCSLTTIAQIGIGTTSPNANAALEVASTSQGMLFPRMTDTQRFNISSPAKGLTIYNTTLNIIQTNTGTSVTPIWKTWNGKNPSSNGTSAVSGYNCLTASAGTLTAKVAVTGVTQTITATVTTIGTYSISATANGVNFTASGTFNATGDQIIELTATGTPSSAGGNTFTLNTIPNCGFVRTTLVNPSSNGNSAVSWYDCSTASAGTLTAGVAVTGVTQTITAMVATLGTYSISATVNGVTFAKNGSFTGTGAQTILLTASGTSTVEGSNTYTINTTPNCSFNRTTLINPSSNGTASVSGYACSTATEGTLTAGVAVTGVTQTITATVTTVGTYSISTTANGVTFAGSGTFAGTGTQPIVLTATGTPTAATASPYTYTLNTTPNCSFTRAVNDPSTNGTGVVSGYTCSTASAGTMVAGDAVSGVTQTITATVTTVGTYSISTTANGVTFSGTGTFLGTSSQDIVLTATGTPTAAGSNTFTLNTTPNCNFSRVTSGIVTSTTGKIWLDRNLGATQVATSSTDHLSYGDFYQWGRGADGHQTIVWTSSTASNGAEQSNETSGTSASTTPGSRFLIGSPNWYTGTNPDDLWQGVSGTNNPCPSGFRIPTDTELDAERSSWSSLNAAGAFASTLKLPVAGRRIRTDGSIDNLGSTGLYWSSTVITTNSRYMFFYSNGAITDFSNRAIGLSVRCIKGDVTSGGTAVVSAYTCSTASSGTMIAGTAVSGVTQTITATVTTVGTYNISAIANGVTFSGSGTFAGTGSQAIVLTATGTPTYGTTNAFILNTTPNCSFDRTTSGNTSSNGTAVVSAYNCSTASAGTMTAGVAVSSITQTITATVTTAGTYTISTTVNGVTFTGSGTFASTGAQDIVLTASGTPTVVGSNSFTLNTNPNCNFNRTVNSLTSNGTAIVSAYSCSTASAGTMTAGVAVSAVTQTITATVTTVGTYSISSTTNGVSFAASGTFLGTGSRNIVLTATGTPNENGTHSFTLNTTPSCSFSRTTNANPSTNGSGVVSGYTCNTASVGTMTTTVPVSGVSQTITANVTRVGSYTISTTVNGVTFTGSGTFASTGAQDIVLTASGTPTVVGSNSFTLNTTPNCSFSRTVNSVTSNGSAVVSAYACSTASAGTMTAGVAVSGVTQTITATVTTVGTYSISATANGVTFAASGTFAGTGARTIVLTATGTPTTLGSNTFTLNTSPYCNYSRTILHPSTNGTAIVNSYICDFASAGTLTAGVAAPGVTQTITANVTTIGSYNISTTANGVTFAASGTFAALGDQNIVLSATGTPIAIGVNTFTLNTAPNCFFIRTTLVNPSSNGTAEVSGYNCTTDYGGKLIVGVAASSVTQTITATVITAGTYSISTNSANGITFTGSGTFTGTGAQNVILTASGTPTATGDDAFTLNTTPDCNFLRHTSLTGCYAKIAISPDVYKDFLCHNLGADTSLDPDVPEVGLNGAYIQWGKRGPNTTGDSRVDWQTAASDGPNGFAAAPTATNPNSAAITSWSSVVAPNYSWRTAAGEKTSNDPCPEGYRVPTATELEGLRANNTASRTLPFTNSTTNYGAALHFGPNASIKTLTWPASGSRTNTGAIINRGANGYYISSTEIPSLNAWSIAFDVTNTVNNSSLRLTGYSVRCIAEDSPTTNGTAEVSNYNCGTASAGTMTASTAVSGVTQTITASVTRIGSYSISTTTANGVTFAASGTFSALGDQTIVLTATGTPMDVGDNTFTLNTTPNCNFSRTTLSNPSSNGNAVVSAYNCTTAYGGKLKVGEAASGVFHTITATVTTAGSYNISITANGVTFSGTGTFAGTGAQTITLTATGTPTASGNNTFPINTTPYCSFIRYTSVTGCYAKTSSTVTKDFLCHNLGADTSLDPDVPVIGLQGAYIQWGKRGPNTTGDSRVDWQTAANDGPSGFAEAPTVANSGNIGVISSWNTVSSANGAWGATKTANDPCPTGYRVPTSTEFSNINSNNTVSRTGTFTDGNTNYDSALHYGPSSTIKTLTFPVAGYRHRLDGLLYSRNSIGDYWSSTEVSTGNANCFNFQLTTVTPASSQLRNWAFSIRCIAE